MRLFYVLTWLCCSLLVAEDDILYIIPGKCVIKFPRNAIVIKKEPGDIESKQVQFNELDDTIFYESEPQDYKEETAPKGGEK